MAKQTGITDAIRAILRDADDSLQIRQVSDALCAAGVPCTPRKLRPIFREREGVGEFIRTEINDRVCYTINPEFHPRRKQVKPLPVVEAFIEARHTVSAAIRDVLSGATRPLPLAMIRQRLDASGIKYSGGDAVSAYLRGGVLAGHYVKYEDTSPARWGLAPSSPPDAVADDSSAPPASDVATAAPNPPQAEQPAAASGSSMPPTGEKAGAAALPERSTTASAVDLDAPIASRPVGGASTRRIPHAFRERLDAIVEDIEAALEDACRAELPHALISDLVSANNAANRAARALER